jgi:hypothetical protein
MTDQRPRPNQADIKGLGEGAGDRPSMVQGRAI